MTGMEAVALIHERAWVGRKPGLERTQQLLERLGNPERELKFVHITGTNGKGSTATMTAAILQAAGYKAGLFTSPHLYHFHERMQINGVNIPDDVLGEITTRVLKTAESMEDAPTEFELMTAVGMEYFRSAGCDIVMLEVGLGGRLDSTNVIPAPEVAVLTNIGLEHTQELGDTLTLIATEKSGIIKEGCRAVLYHQEVETEYTVKAVCQDLNVPLHITQPDTIEILESGLEGQTFRYRGEGPYHINLLGEHQLQNTSVVLEIIDALQASGWKITQEHVLEGLNKAQWPGRLELVRRSPDFIVDGGHNPQCLDALMGSLEKLYPQGKIIFLVGVLADKDYDAMFRRAIPMAKAFVTITPESDRALDTQELANYLSQFGLPVVVRDTVAEGVDGALELAGADDVICAWGSLYSVGEIRHKLGLC